MRNRAVLGWLTMNALAFACAGGAGRPPSPPGSVFLPGSLTRQARNIQALPPQSATMRQEVITAAKPWLAYSDDALWEMMFGNTIKRSWMVWSNGYCPACRKSVPLYNWVMDAHQHPWKVRCPHCKELFPKNDFEKFYRSGLDDNHVFDPRKADRSLLFNVEHPDQKDPLHLFGVDDGEGYVADGHRWRFIGAYLIYGQWKQLILGGITRMSAAYAVTGDGAYAHRVGVLLDRVADLYPSHDFSKQGVMYEGTPGPGYVSTWHDACAETREMALAYDMVREAIGKDVALSSFLAGKAKAYHIAGTKSTPADVVANIDKGILRDPIQNRGRIISNYPQTDMTLAILKSVLNEPEGREQARSIMEEVIRKSTAVDGLTGEKGLTGYAVYATQNIAAVLALYSRADPSFLKELLQKVPRLAEMFRFHIDTWCGMMFYPRIGDCSAFGRPDPGYAAALFSRSPGMDPSMYSFFWQLYELTGDAAFVQVLYHANANKPDGLPYDLFETDSASFQKRVEEVIKRVGLVPKQTSVDKKEWHLAILKAGSGDRNHALWLDYDSGGYHNHADGLNIGLFAYGLDLLPDFGYPPVQFGGWGSPRAAWYMSTAAHNTVVVDGKNQRNEVSPTATTDPVGFQGLPAGKTTLWADGRSFKAVRADAPDVYNLDGYDRTVGMADVSDDDFYILDLFRVRGGTDHARMTYSSFGAITTDGLDPAPAPDYGHGAQLRHFRTDAAPHPGWSVDWKIEDRYKLLPRGEDVHLRLTDLTQSAEASVAEAWIAASTTASNDGEWIPCVMTRRKAQGSSLDSDFVGILQPYRTRPFIVSARRLSARSGRVAAEVTLQDGRRDLWILGSPSKRPPEVVVNQGEEVRFAGDMAFVRRKASSALDTVAVFGGRSLKAGGWAIDLAPGSGFVEMRLEEGRAILRSGSKDAVLSVKLNGNVVPLEPEGAQK